MAWVHLDSNLLADFCRRHSIRELSLFGSVTRNDFRPDSDVDVLVEFEPGAAIGLLELAEISDALESLLGHDVDLVTKASLSAHFRNQVMANREVVYVQP